MTPEQAQVQLEKRQQVYQLQQIRIQYKLGRLSEQEYKEQLSQIDLLVQQTNPE